MMAHDLKLRYEIIESDISDDADQRTKHTRVFPTPDGPRRSNKHQSYGRAILQEPSYDILDALGEDIQIEGDDADLGGGRDDPDS
jgi:hypothetical protein